MPSSQSSRPAQPSRPAVNYRDPMVVKARHEAADHIQACIAHLAIARQPLDMSVVSEMQRLAELLYKAEEAVPPDYPRVTLVASECEWMARSHLIVAIQELRQVGIVGVAQKLRAQQNRIFPRATVTKENGLEAPARDSAAESTPSISDNAKPEDDDDGWELVDKDNIPEQKDSGSCAVQ